MQEETETTIVINELDTGEEKDFRTNQDGIDQALRLLMNMFHTKVDEIYKGVKSIMLYGAFVGIGKNTDGLLHLKLLGKIRKMLSQF